MTALQQTKVLPPHEGPRVSVAGDIYTIKISGKETDDAYALIEAEVPPGGGPPPHIHAREDEAFYILDGHVTFQSDGRTILAGPGTFLHLRRGTLHAFKNTGSKTARMLVHVQPAGLEEFFGEVGHWLPDNNTPPPPVTAADIEKLVAVAPRYGIQIRLPPDS